MIFRRRTILAITQRFFALYREWYDSLLIADLMPKWNSES